MFQTRLVSAVPNELAAECIIVTVFAQLVHIIQVSLLEAQLSEQSFPAHCLKLCPTPCCFTWFHNTALSVRGAYKQSLGVAVLVRSLLITTGVRIVILCVLSLPAISVSCRPEEKRQVIHYSSVNKKPQPTCRKRSANSSPLSIPQLCCCVPEEEECPAALIRAGCAF